MNYVRATGELGHDGVISVKLPPQNLKDAEVAVVDFALDFEPRGPLTPISPHFPVMAFSRVPLDRVSPLNIKHVPGAVQFPHKILTPMEMYVNFTFFLQGTSTSVNYATNEDCLEFYAARDNAKRFLYLHRQLAYYFFGHPQAQLGPRQQPSFVGEKVMESETYYVLDVNRWDTRVLLDGQVVSVLKAARPFMKRAPFHQESLLSLTSTDVRAETQGQQDSNILCHLPIPTTVFRSHETHHLATQPRLLTYLATRLTITNFLRMKLTQAYNHEPFHFLPPTARFALTLAMRTPPTTKQITIHLNSGQRADSKLSIKFPQPLPLALDKRWSVSLTSISLPTSMLLPLTQGEREIRVLIGSRRYDIVLPTGVASADEVGESISLQTGGHLRIKVEKGHLLFEKGPLPALILMKDKTALFLGFDDASLRRFEYQDNTAGTVVEISPTASVPAPKAVQLEENFPRTFAVKCPQLEPTWINGKFDTVLRLVQASRPDVERTWHSSFIHSEFHALTMDRVDEFTLHLQTLEGDDIPFDGTREGEIVHATLTLNSS